MVHCLHLKQRGRGQPVPVRGTWYREKSDDPPYGGPNCPRVTVGSARSSHLLPPRDREWDKGLLKQGDILLLVAGGSQLSATLLPCPQPPGQPASQVKNALFPPSALPLLTLPTSRPTAEPTLAPTLTSTFLIFGVPVVVGFILVLATLCGFLACKVGKWRRKRKAADEKDKGRRPLPLPLTTP